MVDSNVESIVNGETLMPGITVVMPCLNEEANLSDAASSTLQALSAKNIDGELIIVNDGSTDGTLRVAQALAATDPRVKVLSHPRPQGIGASFLHGVREASKSHVTMFPGDNENDPDDALTYFYLTRDVDIVVPFIHNVEIRSRVRRIISSIYRFIINVSFGMNLNYTNGTVIYNTAVLREVNAKSRGFFYQAELLIRVIRRGYLYAETPHFLSDRKGGKTKALTLRSFLSIVRAYLHLVFDIHILRSEGVRDMRLNPASATYRRYQQLGAKRIGIAA
ncbi:MAG: glycosyltransferase family 2 protein [Gammaproteobacteria bacterium]